MIARSATTAPGEKQPSVADFTKLYGPWIIFATVIVPLIVAATINWLRKRKRYVLTGEDRTHTATRTAFNHLYVALVAPLGELSARLGWGVLIVLTLGFQKALLERLFKVRFGKIALENND